MARHRYHRFEYQTKSYQRPLAKEVLEKQRRFLDPSLFDYYQKPLNIVEGNMQYLYNEKGRRYLDAFTGIVTVLYGHHHPHVFKAITKQTKLLQHATTIYLHHAVADFAKALTAKMPRNLKVLYFVNSGLEANELAMMMVRLYIGNGLPLGAIVTTPEIASVMAQKIQFSTFGGNPVCSIGRLAVLRELIKRSTKIIVLLLDPTCLDA